jgi:hypothetical protein
MARSRRAECIADVAAFLCSDDARFITGETIRRSMAARWRRASPLLGHRQNNTFMKSAGDRGTTGEAMVVRNLQSGEQKK